MKSRTPILTLLVILTTILAYGCSLAATPTAQPGAAASPTATSTGVTAEGRLEPVRFVELSAAADGSISSLMAAQGDEVQAGQVILQLQSPVAPKAPPPKCTLVPIKIPHRIFNFRQPLFLSYAQRCEPASTAGSQPQTAQTLDAAQASAALRLANAHQAVHDAQTQLDNFAIPAKFSGMTAADAAQAALAELQTALAEFEPYKGESVQGLRANNSYAFLPNHVYVDTEYYKPGLAKEYKKKVDNAWIDYRRAIMWLQMQSALESAQADVAQAQQDVNNLQDAAMSEDTAGTRAALANAELRAPFAGTLTNFDVKVGDAVTSGKPMATLADLSSWVIKTTDLTENDVIKIREGQIVDITFDALPGTTLRGTVQSIAQNYAQKQGDIVYEVSVRLSDTLPGMRWGMTGKLHFAE